MATSRWPSRPKAEGRVGVGGGSRIASCRPSMLQHAAGLPYARLEERVSASAASEPLIVYGRRVLHTRLLGLIIIPLASLIGAATLLLVYHPAACSATLPVQLDGVQSTMSTVSLRRGHQSAGISAPNTDGHFEHDDDKYDDSYDDDDDDDDDNDDDDNDDDDHDDDESVVQCSGAARVGACAAAGGVAELVCYGAVIIGAIPSGGASAALAPACLGMDAAACGTAALLCPSSRSTSSSRRLLTDGGALRPCVAVDDKHAQHSKDAAWADVWAIRLVGLATAYLILLYIMDASGWNHGLRGVSSPTEADLVVHEVCSRRRT